MSPSWAPLPAFVIRKSLQVPVECLYWWVRWSVFNDSLRKKEEVTYHSPAWKTSGSFWNSSGKPQESHVGSCLTAWSWVVNTAEDGPSRQTLKRLRDQQCLELSPPLVWAPCSGKKRHQEWLVQDTGWAACQCQSCLLFEPLRSSSFPGKLTCCFVQSKFLEITGRS